MSTPQNENWYRIASLVYEAILPALISVIHNDNGVISSGLPRNDADLYNELHTIHKKTLDTLLRKKVIDQAQYDLLLPATGKTDSSNFDVSLAYLVIRNLFNLKCKSRWNINTLRSNTPMEKSIAAYVMRGKEVRNFLSHNKPSSITQQMLDDQWKEGEEVVNGLNYKACDLAALKVAPLDSKTIKRLEARMKSNETMLQTVEKRVDTIETKMPGLKKDVADIRQEIPDLQQEVDFIQQEVDVVTEDIGTLKQEIPSVREDMDSLQRDLNQMQVDSLSMILGILHSKEKHLLQVDESMKSMDQTIKKIRDEVHHLKIKDLNLSHYQLERIIIHIGNKFSYKSSKKQSISCETCQEIDHDLKEAQKSALTGLSSGLGYLKQIQCIKVILITDCFYVLNALSSLQEIKSDEIQVFTERLMNAQDTCESTLRKLNNITEVRDYLSTKLLAGSEAQSFSQRCRRKLATGIDNAAVSREVIMINLCIRFFFQHYEEKLSGKRQRKKKGMKKKASDKMKGMFGDGTLEKERNKVSVSNSTELIKPSVSSELLELDKDIIYIGAAFSVIKSDADLAMMVDNYIMMQTDPGDHLELMKKFFRDAKGVQKAVEKKRVKMLNNKEGKKQKLDPKGSLKVFNSLAITSTMERYLSDSSGCSRYARVDDNPSVEIADGDGVDIIPTSIEPLSFRWSGKEEPHKAFDKLKTASKTQSL